MDVQARVLGDGGRIRVGGRADVVISTLDPFEIPAQHLIGLGTAATVVAGRIVYERAALPAEN